MVAAFGSKTGERCFILRLAGHILGRILVEAEYGLRYVLPPLGIECFYLFGNIAGHIIPFGSGFVDLVFQRVDGLTVQLGLRNRLVPLGISRDEGAVELFLLVLHPVDLGRKLVDPGLPLGQEVLLLLNIEA